MCYKQKLHFVHEIYYEPSEYDGLIGSDPEEQSVLKHAVLDVEYALPKGGFGLPATRRSYHAPSDKKISYSTHVARNSTGKAR